MYLSNNSFCQRGEGIKPLNDSNGINYALVVGISHYAHIKPLNYAHEDAFLFSDYLINNRLCQKRNVQTLVDSMATMARFYEQLERFLNIGKPHDKVFIYFAGHGDIETNLQTGFLLTFNSENHNYPANNISVLLLEQYVNAFAHKGINVILIIDACHGLKGSEATSFSLINGFKDDKKIIKMLSCQSNELAGERYYPGGGHGIFTYHLVNGLNGLADTNGKFYITVDDIEDYLSIVKIETNRNQHAQVFGDRKAIIATYDTSVKSSVMNRIQNNNEQVFKRHISDSVFENNAYYQKLNKQISAGLLTEPPGDNAYYTISEAISNKVDSEIVKDMKLHLAATLEDEAQLWLNKYLRGEVDRKISRIRSQSFMVKKYLEIALQLMNENAFRYREIYVKKLFFGALYESNTGGKKELLRAIDSLEKANRLIPDQAWIIHWLGHCYQDLKQNEKAQAAFQRSLELAPAWMNGWACLGGCY